MKRWSCLETSFKQLPPCIATWSGVFSNNSVALMLAPCSMRNFVRFPLSVFWMKQNEKFIAVLLLRVYARTTTSSRSQMKWRRIVISAWICIDISTMFDEQFNNFQFTWNGNESKSKEAGFWKSDLVWKVPFFTAIWRGVSISFLTLTAAPWWTRMLTISRLPEMIMNQYQVLTVSLNLFYYHILQPNELAYLHRRLKHLHRLHVRWVL